MYNNNNMEGDSYSMNPAAGTATLIVPESSIVTSNKFLYENFETEGATLSM
jgi:hypothetical protein